MFNTTQKSVDMLHGPLCKKIICFAIHTAILFAILFGICGAVLGQFIAEPLLILIKTPDSVLTAAVMYLRIYFIGYPFLWLLLERLDFHLSIKKLRIKRECLLPVLTIGIPSAIQGAVFCFANIFGQAATTFTSQNFAAGLKKRCRKLL